MIIEDHTLMTYKAMTAGLNMQLPHRLAVWLLLQALLEAAPCNLLATTPCYHLLNANPLPPLARPTMATDCCGICKPVLA